MLVRALPGSRRNECCGAHQGRLKVAVTQVAEKGKANKAIAKVLAHDLNVKTSQVRLLSGETTRDKSFLISGILPEAVARRLAALS